MANNNKKMPLSVFARGMIVSIFIFVSAFQLNIVYLFTHLMNKQNKRLILTVEFYGIVMKVFE